MQASEFDESAFFAAIEKSGARVLLIGRRALVALGMPVLVLPSLAHLILTKRWAMRPHDLEDIRFLEGLGKAGDAQ